MEDDGSLNAESSEARHPPLSRCSRVMQPQDSPIGSDAAVSPLAQVSRARDLWFRADFLACLKLLDGLEEAGTLEGPLRSEAYLLRARALYRLRRFDDVVSFLGPLLTTFSAIDEACTARMLHATALARSGNVNRGLALLNEVAASAQGLHVHPTIIAEISHSLALVHWLNRELAQVLRYALQAESARADVISVRATQLRGFVALTMRRFPEALALFRDAHAAYRACKERDDDLEQATVLQIASLELTLRSARVGGTHDVPWRRISADRRSDVASVVKMQLCTLDAWLYAHDGNRERAFHNIRLAEGFAPDEAWRTWALAGRAAIANAFNNADSAREHAAEAAEIAQRVDWDSTIGEERMALLFLAEVLAVTDPPLALSIYRRYTSLKPKTLELDGFWKDDPRRVAFESHMRGLISRLEHRPADAHSHFDSAYRMFRDCGHLWRATLSLIELDATPVAGSPRGDFYLEAAALIIRKHFPRSFLARRIGRWLTAYDDPIVSKLTPAPREILRYLLDGYVPKDIAAIRGLAEGTVRNHVALIEAAFNVHSIQEVIVACYKRGLGTASWQDSLDPSALAMRVVMPRDRSVTR